MSENEKPASGKSDQIEIGALWKKQGKTEKYLFGKLNLKPININEEISIVVFSNKSKKQDNHPDLRVYISRPMGAKTPVKTAAAPAPAPAAPESDEIL